MLETILIVFCIKGDYIIPLHLIRKVLQAKAIYELIAENPAMDGVLETYI